MRELPQWNECIGGKRARAVPCLLRSNTERTRGQVDIISLWSSDFHRFLILTWFLLLCRNKDSEL